MVDERRLFREQKKELAAANANANNSTNHTSPRARESRASRPRRSRRTTAAGTTTTAPISRISTRQPSVGLISRPIGCSNSMSRADSARRQEQALNDDISEEYQAPVSSPAVLEGLSAEVERQWRLRQEEEQQQQQFDSATLSGDGTNDYQEEESNALPARRRLQDNDDERLHTLEAIRVESEKHVACAIAEKDSFLSSLKRSQVGQCSLFLACLIIVGLVVGLSLAFSMKSGSSKNGGDGMRKGHDHDDDENFFHAVAAPVVGETVGGQFGSSISMNRDGTRMAVADLETVYIYELVLLTGEEEEEADDTTAASENENNAAAGWILLTTIEAPENAILDGPCHDDNNTSIVLDPVTVDMSPSGTFVIIGWPYSANEEGLEPGTGRVEVHQEEELEDQTGTVARLWQRVGYPLFGWQADDNFGASVVLRVHGNQVMFAVASPGNGGVAAVYLLLNQGVWVLLGDVIRSYGELLAMSVAFDKGRTLAIAGQNDNNEDDRNPVARIYRFTDDLEWVEMGDGLYGVFENTAYLVEISSDGNTVALSNYYTTPWQGELNDALDVRVFEWDGTNEEWVQMGDDLHASAPGEKSGYFITLSDDGRWMGMGDPGRQSDGGHSVAGHIHVFTFDDASHSWVQLGPNKDGDAPGDQFGSAISMSGDGTRMAAGAPFNRGEGVELGRVHVFEIDPADLKPGSSSEDGWN